MKTALLALAAATALGLSLTPLGVAFAENHHGDNHAEHGADRAGDHASRGNSAARPDRGYSDERGPRTYHDGAHCGGGGGGSPATYRGERWDDHRNNGYWMNSRWHYGPPPEDDYGRPGFALGRSDWRLGGYLPPYYRGLVVNDYEHWRLRRPPYGYNWIHVGNDYLLVAAGTGLIFDIVRY